MIAQKSLEPLIWCYNFGSWLNILPYYWNQNESCLILLQKDPEMRKKYELWKSFAIFNIFIHVGVMIGFFCIMMFVQNIQSEEIILLIFMNSIALMSTSAHIYYITSSSKFVTYMNALLQWNRDARTGMYDLRLNFEISAQNISGCEM